jgi:hypothetical protein
MLDAAAAHSDSLDTLEELGRVYSRELAAGTFGNWLAARFDEALPDHRDRLTVARFLQDLAGKGHADYAPLLPPRVWKGLIEEEWADETPLGPRWRLQTVEWDWLWLVTASLTGSSQRAEARALHTLLARAEPDWRIRETAPYLAAIRERILDLPQRGFPTTGKSAGDQLHPPDICSVCPEPSDGAQLFWCYGFHDGRRDVPEAACVLLIALCAEEPAPAVIEAWRRELKREERLLSGGTAGRTASKQNTGFRGELWLVLPAMASQEIDASARRFSFEVFARWLEIQEIGDEKEF